MKRFLSLLLACVMMLSLVTIAHADEAIEVTYLNADSTKIMVDLSADVAVADLTKAISLKKDGAPVNFTVVKKPASVTSTGAMTAVTDTSYVIKPEGGVVIGAIYNISIATAGYDKFFTVDELWRDDFQAYTGETGATISWRNGTLYVDGSDKYLKVTGMSGKGTYPYFDGYMFSTYGMDAAHFFDAARLATTDYNVEAKVKFGESTDGSAYRTVQISMQKERGQTVGRWGSVPCIAGGALYNIKADGTNEYNKIFLDAYQKANTTDRQGIGGITDNIHQCDAPKIKEKTFNVGWNTISMSVKGNNAKVFAGEDAFANYNNTLDLSTTGYGAVVFISRSSGTYYIDDVIATKMREVELSDMAVNYWNADSTKIMLDLSANVDASALKSAITLTKNGVAVTDFTVTKKSATPEGPGAMTANPDYAYVIAPQGGIELSTSEKETVYTLSIDKGLVSSDKTKVLSETYSVNFAVDKLWIEDFENESYDTSAVSTFPWKDHAGKAVFNLVKENGNTVLEVSNVSQSYGNTIRPNADSSSVFADTGLTAAQCWNKGLKSYVGGYLENEDYTVEVKVRALETTETSQNQSRSIRMFLMSSPSTCSFGYVTGVAGGGYYSKNASTGAVNKNMYAQVGLTNGNNSVAAMQGAGTETSSLNYFNGVSVPDEPFAASYSQLAIAAKAKNVKIFAGDAFVNYDHTLELSDYGCVGFSTHSSRTFYLDDITATKAREVAGSLTFGDLTVTDGAGETIESLTGVETIDVTVPFNRLGAALPCKVVLAVYGANNTLKNYAFSTITTFDGANTIEFNDVATNGGTSIKVFFWDGLATLMPYRATAQWPAAN